MAARSAGTPGAPSPSRAHTTTRADRACIHSVRATATSTAASVSRPERTEESRAVPIARTPYTTTKPTIRRVHVVAERVVMPPTRPLGW